MTPEEVYKQLGKGLYHFISGPAGSGKSYLLRQLKSLDPWNSYLAATTGVAAVQLSSEAVTIHSLLGGYYDVEDLARNLAEADRALKWRSKKGSKAIKIYIDEVSMLSDEHLTILVDVIERHNETARMPTSLILSGDFMQLPPVDGAFAFESKEWNRFEKSVIKLEGTYRQADKDFIEALRLTRSGDGKKALEYFRPMIHRSIDSTLGATTLFYKNIDVNKYNKKQIATIDGAEDKYTTVRTGNQLKEWNRSKIPDVLKLKRGCQVMLLANSYANDDDERRRLVYANGDLGTYVGKEEEGEAIVRLLRNQEVVVVKSIRRQSVGASGSIDYMPIKAAYASTIHKIQGLSLDSIQVVITDPSFTRTPGLLYVALSRAKTPAGIRIVGTPQLFIERCRTDRRVKEWL